MITKSQMISWWLLFLWRNQYIFTILTRYWIEEKRSYYHKNILPDLEKTQYSSHKITLLKNVQSQMKDRQNNSEINSLSQSDSNLPLKSIHRVNFAWNITNVASTNISNGSKISFWRKNPIRNSRLRFSHRKWSAQGRMKKQTKNLSWIKGASNTEKIEMKRNMNTSKQLSCCTN